MKTLYIEPFSGLSGDMLLSALCGLADYYDEIVKLPAKLHLHDGKVVINTVNKNGIVCNHVHIIDLGADGNHKHTHEHSHDHNHSHSHDHDHSHSHGHRHLKDIINLIDNGHISDGAKEIAKGIFNIIGTSEAKIHNMDIDTIHFHEVSAVDSILDIVGCAVLIDLLDIGTTYSDAICTGYGMVKTQHGLLPVPAPATADILSGLPTYKGTEEGERVTPTGAAVLKYLNPEFTVPTYTSEKIAYGPGQKDFIGPNVVRLSLIQVGKKKTHQNDSVMVIETNIDDSPAEFLGIDFQSTLLEANALDVFMHPIQMKKGRPALKLSVLCRLEDLDALSQLILEHTSAIGLRYYQAGRVVLPRKSFTKETPLGTVTIKEVETPSGGIRRKIEFDSLQKISVEKKIPLWEVSQRIYAFLEKQ